MRAFLAAVPRLQAAGALGAVRHVHASVPGRTGALAIKVRGFVDVIGVCSDYVTEGVCCRQTICAGAVLTTGLCASCVWCTVVEQAGMMTDYDGWGQRHAVTVLMLDECQVTQVKTEETDG